MVAGPWVSRYGGMPIPPAPEPPVRAHARSGGKHGGSGSGSSSSSSSNSNSNNNDVDDSDDGARRSGGGRSSSSSNDDSSSSSSREEEEESTAGFNTMRCEEFTKFFLCKQSPTGDCYFVFGAYPPRGDGRVVPLEVADIRYGRSGERHRHRALCPVSVKSWRHAPAAIL